MALSDADTLTLARTLWPGVTVAAASDAFLTAWLPTARAFVSELRIDSYDTGVACLLAHFAYWLDPADVLGSGGASAPGAVASLSTLGLSASYAVQSSTASASMTSDAAFEQTKPGQMWLSIRNASGAVIAPFMV